MLHDPLLNTYFLGNGHQTYDCVVPDCIGCAVAEAFADFNSGEKTEGFAALSLLLASWKCSSVGCRSLFDDCKSFSSYPLIRNITDARWLPTTGCPRILSVSG